VNLNNYNEITKGDWHWNEDFKGAKDKNYLVNDRGEKVLIPVKGLNGGFSDVGIRTGDWDNEEELRANALLIADVPKLLEYCKQLEKELKNKDREEKNNVKNY
jgi:hypothetical protein